MKKIAELGFNVVGADIYLYEQLPIADNITYKKDDITNLSFVDNSFDYVISTHTLEHVVDIQKAISELRRVCKKHLIIIVPCQREYRYTFDLHIHFFPYIESLQRVMRNNKNTCFKLDGDFICIEQKFT